MLRPQGYLLVSGPGEHIEYDTITCSHCNGVVIVKPGTAATTYLIKDQFSGLTNEEPGAACRVCMKAVCLRCCDSTGGCVVWERKMERMEARARLLRSVGV